MVIKSMDIHVLSKLASETTVFASLDLWMSRGGIDTFVLVINYLYEDWEHVHAIVGLFDVMKQLARAWHNNCNLCLIIVCKFYAWIMDFALHSSPTSYVVAQTYNIILGF
jgi:hypothetical protein